MGDSRIAPTGAGAHKGRPYGEGWIPAFARMTDADGLPKDLRWERVGARAGDGEGCDNLDGTLNGPQSAVQRPVDILVGNCVRVYRIGEGS